MPQPRKNEKQKEYISRCIAFVMHEGKTHDPSQAAAICHSMFREWKKKQRKESDIVLILKVGTSASGNRGHAGRPGKVGGSQPGNARDRIRVTPQKPMQPSAGGDRQREYDNLQWESSTTPEQTRKSIENFKKNGIEKVTLEYGANGSYVDVSNDVVNDLFNNHPYVKNIMAKKKIFEFQITGNKLLDGNLVGFYADDILMMSKKGVELSRRSIQKDGIDVVEGKSKGDRPFSSSNGIAHEIGHHLINSDRKVNEGFMAAWEDIWKKEIKNPKFTEYGSTVDSEEGFAEAFALYTNRKGRSRLLPATISFMEWYLGEGKKKKKELGLILMFKMGVAGRSGNFGHQGGKGGKGNPGGSTSNDEYSNIPNKTSFGEPTPLSKSEVEHVRYYSNDGAWNINSTLRSGRKPDSLRDKALIKAMDKILEKSPSLKKLIIAYRGLDTEVDNLKEGSVFTEKGFTSLTDRFNALYNYAAFAILHVTIPKGVKVFDIEASISEAEGTKEIVLPRNARFKVTRVEKGKHPRGYADFKVIHLQYLPEKRNSKSISDIEVKGGSGSGNYGHVGIIGHQGGSASGGKGKIDITSYKKMSAQAKVKVLKGAIKSYIENYVPKAKQIRILNKLSKKGKTQWLESNKRIGQLEGMRRAMIARGNSSSRVEQRKNYHFGIKLQEQVAKVKGDMNKYKSLGLLSYFK